MNKRLNTIFISVLLTIGLKGFAQTAEPTAIVPISGGSSYLIEPINVVATSGGTMYLTNLSKTNQVLTGTSANNVVLPNSTTLKKGRYFNISNRSTQSITVQYNDLSTAKSLAADSQAKFMVRVISTANGTWDITNTVASIDLENPSQISGVLQTANGGVGYSSYASGDLLYGYGSSLLKLAFGTTGYVLTASSAGYPTWQAVTSSGSSLPSFISASLLTNDGTNPYWVSGTGLFAKTDLSNLSNPTSLNQDLLPDSDATRKAGSITQRFSEINAQYGAIPYMDYTNTAGSDYFGSLGADQYSKDMVLESYKDPGSGSNPEGLLIRSYKPLTITTIGPGTYNSSKIEIKTANNSSGFSSGDLLLATGTVTGGGSRGSIYISGTQVLLNNIKISSMAEPTTVSDAATKNYVDTKVISLPSNITGVLGATNGGTGQSTYSVGDILYSPAIASVSRLPIGASGTFIVANGAGVPEYIPMLISGAVLNVTTISNAYTLLSSDVTVLASGASSFAISVPDASTMPYHTFEIKKTDTNPVVISLTGAITNHHLYTPNETWKFQSDGTNWKVLAHRSAYQFNPEVISIGGVTTAPNFCVVVKNQQVCERRGAKLECRYNFDCSASGGTAGSGHYLYKAPQAISGVGTFNTTRHPVPGAAIGSLRTHTYAVGNCFITNTSTHDYNAALVPFDATRMKLVSVVANAYQGSGTFGFGATVELDCHYQHSINEWEEDQ